MFMPKEDFSVTLPQKRKIKRYIPTERDVKHLLRHTKNHEMLKAIALAFCMGDRRSEVCALRYKHLDKARGMITVESALVCGPDNTWHEKNTKTEASERITSVPQVVFDILGDGEPEERVVKLTPVAITDAFPRLLEAAGLPHFRFHDLRHFNASIMLALDIPDLYAQRRGGWKTNHTLKTVYQHLLDPKEAEVNEKCDAYFGSILEGAGASKNH